MSPCLASRGAGNDVNYAADSRRHLDLFMTVLRPNLTTTEYRFGSCRLLVPSRELYRDGSLIAVEPKVFDLLVFLIANRDRAIDKNELQDEVWSGTVVTETSVTRCVMKARRAIRPVRGEVELITTVRGHGYRFTGEVKELSPDSSRQGPARNLPDKPSLVVLPFANLSSDPEQEYFSDGITEDIITELSRFRSLFVIGRQSAFTFKGHNLTTRQIAGDLGVAYVVDGSLRRSGQRIRITARLVDAANDSQLWAERYDRDIEDVLLVQEEVATTVAATVGGRVEATRGRTRIDAERLKSYDCLLKAQALYYEFAKDANLKARDLLEQAVNIDPDNARALAILAAVHSMDSWSFWSENIKRSQQLSLQMGRRSIELDDTDSLAQALFAEILWDCDQTDLSEHHFKRALRLNPNDVAAHALYASKLRSAGRLDEAFEHIKIARRLDPFSLNWIPLIEGAIWLAAKRYDHASDAILSMINPPNEARLTLMAALGRLGRKDRAYAVRTDLLNAARRDMPDFPGERLVDWVPVFKRMLVLNDPAELDQFLDSLRLAGWE